MLDLNQPESEIDMIWTKEAKKRLEELRSGQVKAIPGEEVFDKIRKNFEKMSPSFHPDAEKNLIRQ